MRTTVGLALSVIGAVCLLPSSGVTQQNAAATRTVSTAASAVPKVVNFSGALTDLNGKALTGVTGVTFLLYKDSQGGTPLWMETQNVNPDKNGRYTVTVGASSSRGVPADVFVSGEARWLGVQVAGQPEQARVLLVAVPYALKAGDAETIGGLPPSAFVLAAPAAAGIAATTDGATAQPSVPPPAAITGSGTTGFIPEFTGAATIGNSAIFQTGTSPTARIGINLSTPVAALEVQGTSTVHGQFTLPSAGLATASGGKKSYQLDLRASSFNSGTAAAVAQNFQWQAEPSGNNTTTPSATLNLLFGAGSATPAETGLKIANNGRITFASGQTFPGAGTITGVTAGTDLTGGGTSGTVTLNLDTTKVPQLNTANTFTQTQFVNTSNTAGSIQASSPGVAILGTSTSTSLLVPAISGVAQDSNVNDLTIGVAGTTNSGRGYGVEGVANSSGIGVYGISTTGIGVIGIGASSSLSVKDTGVLAFANSPVGTGVHGYAWNTSALGTTLNNLGTSVGVWADTSGQTQTSNAGAALLTTADNAWSVFSGNNSTSYPTMVVKNYETSNNASTIFLTFSDTFGGLCTINVHGDLTCSGSVSAVVPVDAGAKQVALYSVVAPESWFEDAGSGELANGSAVIRLEKIFAQTVNTGMDYHVFLTPNGDCKGLYVTKKTATSFEVHELGGGKSSTGFDYRIMAKRKGYEGMRLADKTKEFAAAAAAAGKGGKEVALTPAR